MGAAFNMWSHGNTVHWPSTYSRLVPLCVEAGARRSGSELPNPDENSDSAWMKAIPHGDAICDDGWYPLSCPDCIEWRSA